MKKGLPGIYKENNTKKINNNRSVYYSGVDEKKYEDNNLEIENEYIFNVPVVIKTVNEVFNTKIVSKVKDHILTSNNRIIKLKDIKSISLLK